MASTPIIQWLRNSGKGQKGSKYFHVRDSNPGICWWRDRESSCLSVSLDMIWVFTYSWKTLCLADALNSTCRTWPPSLLTHLRWRSECESMAHHFVQAQAVGFLLQTVRCFLWQHISPGTTSQRHMSFLTSHHIPLQGPAYLSHCSFMSSDPIRATLTTS